MHIMNIFSVLLMGKHKMWWVEGGSARRCESSVVIGGRSLKIKHAIENGIRVKCNNYILHSIFV